MGNDYFRNGNYEQAKRHYGTAISINKQEALYYSNLAAALTKLKDYDTALSIIV